MKTIIIAVLLMLMVFLGFVAIFQVWERNDKAMMEAGDKYTQCVKDQYHTTPWEYYGLNGNYPECK